MFDGRFQLGDNFFFMFLQVLAQNNSYSDFSNTGTIEGITLLDPDFSLGFADDLFVLDPNQPGRYVPSINNVPAPGTVILLLTALGGLALRGRHRKSAGTGGVPDLRLGRHE